MDTQRAGSHTWGAGYVPLARAPECLLAALVLFGGFTQHNIQRASRLRRSHRIPGAARLMIDVGRELSATPFVSSR